jgi:pectate lyase
VRKLNIILFACAALSSSVLFYTGCSGGSQSGSGSDASATGAIASSSPASTASSSASSSPSQAPVTPDPSSMTKFNLSGFATVGTPTTGGGEILETDAAYAKVTTPQQFIDAIYCWYKAKAYGSYTVPIKVIEIANDLDLGYLEVGTSVTSSTSGSSIMSQHAAAKLHPVLMAAGVSKIDIKSKSGLTIFSKNGSTIRHAMLNIKSTSNIIVRNLKFDEMWEWDEGTKGDYDTNDWDFIDIGNGGVANNVWIDHCSFTKAYDGIVDVKGGAYNITISWCKYLGDDGATNSNSFVRQQLNALEANMSSYPMYNFLRTNGFTLEDIVKIIQGHDKTHLIGASTSEAEKINYTFTMHHNLFMNPWDRLPRLRGGQVHVYNIFVDDTLGLAAKRFRDSVVATMSAANQIKLNGSGSTAATYKFNPFLNGTISTEGGAILVENSVYKDCITPLRNNQTDVNDATYTGKVKALNTIYYFDNADGSVTNLQGNSTDLGVFPAAYANGAGVMGPGQAAIIDFAWNTAAWNTIFPYTYLMDDPTALRSILDANAGAGAISLTAAQWLKTAY